MPTFDRFGVPAGARTSVDEWKIFSERRFRTFHGIGATAAAVFALAGDGLTIPLLLALGTPVAAATIIGVLPYAFSSAQLLVPSLLRRTDGNLRRVTLGILALGETRGFVLAGVVLLQQLHLIPSAAAIVAIAAVMSIAGAASAIGGANLLAWYGAILAEGDRRFVAPRVMGITQGLGAVLAPSRCAPRAGRPGRDRPARLRDHLRGRGRLRGRRADGSSAPPAFPGLALFGSPPRGQSAAAQPGDEP